MFLEIKGIKKHYGEGESRVEVLNGIDIEVNKGEILGNDGRCSIIGNEIGFNNLGATGNTSTHGNEASFETVVAKNPEYIFVMDRDKAIGTAGVASAKEIVENDLVKSTPAYKNNHIFYLENPNVWYTAEGGRHLFHRMSVQVTKREPRKPCFEVLVSVL